MCERRYQPLLERQSEHFRGRKRMNYLNFTVYPLDRSIDQTQPRIRGQGSQWTTQVSLLGEESRWKRVEKRPGGYA